MSRRPRRLGAALRPYWSMYLLSTRRMMAYRVNMVLAWLGGVTYLVASFAIWRALLADGPIGVYDWDTMRTYLLIGWAAGAIGSAYGDWWMASRILEGDVAIDLTKPLDYQRARFAEQMGGLVIELGAIMVAVAGVIAFTGWLPLPADGVQLALFLASFALIAPLVFGIAFLTTMVCFWTHNFFGVSWAKSAVTVFFSGALVPLAMLPDWLETVARVLPFSGLVATPAAIYLNQVTGLQALGLVGAQLAWVLVLWFGARLLWRRALRALTIHGG